MDPSFDKSNLDFYLEQAMDGFNIDLADTNESWASRFEAQLSDSLYQDSPFDITHSLSNTASRTGTPALDLGSFPVTPQSSSIPSSGNAIPPPKIGARFSREAVRVLRQWVSAHSEHPFPNEEEKEILRLRTGLTKTQILNWLANARRRGKIHAHHTGSPQSPGYGSQAIGIPGRKATPAPEDRTRLMNPLERWVDSPPEHEPATATAIARAMATSRSSLELGHLRDHQEPPRFLSRPSSTSSIGTSQSSDMSAYSHQSRDSITSFKSSNRRRRHGLTNKRVETRTSLARSMGAYECTFCSETFKTKHTWQRHEKSLHLPIEKWACAPHGPRTINADGISCCVFCAEPSPDDAHIESHNFSACQGRTLQDRAFNRKDHLSQHLRLVHNVTAEQLGCSLNQWKLPTPGIRSVCGFCGLKMDTWAFRVDHLADHFKMGCTMADWKGDWGFDPSVLFRVEHAIPPYVIASDRDTLCPFEASKGPADKPRNAFELIKLELVHFVHVYSDRFGNLPTFKKMHLEACRILLSAEVISDHQDSNASWVRDLLLSDDDILQQAKMTPVRSTLEGKLRRLRIPGKDNLFDSCPFESQLDDFVRGSPSRSVTDVDLQQEASQIIQQHDLDSSAPAEYVLTLFLELINSSTVWLTAFRDRHEIPRPESSCYLPPNSLSRINTIIQNYNELERTLADYVELLRAHGIVPDDTTLRQKANDIIVNEISDLEWTPVAINNEAWFAKFKSRHLLGLTETNEPVKMSMEDFLPRDPLGVHHPAQSQLGAEPPPPQYSDNTANSLMKTSFLLNGDCFHRWIARELARWVAMTMSPNNPSRHVPTDEELQHQARWILFNDDDPWNQTVAENPEWLRRFKIDVGILTPPVQVGDASQDGLFN
ncbi:hypothetical protein ACJ41O_005647 [Fusarium nematophilum]